MNPSIDHCCDPVRKLQESWACSCGICQSLGPSGEHLAPGAELASEYGIWQKVVTYLQEKAQIDVARIKFPEFAGVGQRRCPGVEMINAAQRGESERCVFGRSRKYFVRRERCGV